MRIPPRAPNSPARETPSPAIAERARSRFGSVREVNYRGVSALVAGAREPHANLASGFMEQLRYPLQLLDLQGQRKLAEFPVLLFDFAFRDAPFWQSLARQIPKAPENAFWLGCIPRARVRSLARAILTLAWHLASSDTEMARLVLGMSPACAEVVGSLRLDELELIAHRQYRCVRPRWDHHPGIWRLLLEAARCDDPDAFSYVSVEGVQLVIADQLELG